MAEFLLKYADARGEVHRETAQGASAEELRERFTDQGYLVYSVRPKGGMAVLTPVLSGRKQKLNMERFLIFNQQFVTLVRAGLPILKGLDLLADRLTDPKLGGFIRAVRDDVKNGALLSDAFRAQGVFPPIYVTSVLAGEKSGSLAEVLDRYIAYQKLSQTMRKKLLVSLIYPAVLFSLVIILVVFLVTYVVPNFAQLYRSMDAKLPYMTELLIAVGTTARSYILVGFAGLVLAAFAVRAWARRETAQIRLDKIKMATPALGDIWVKYQVAQFARILGTLLIGGIPLVQALDTAAQSLNSRLLRSALGKAQKQVKEGQSLSAGLATTKMVPALAIDMIEVGESTGALPAMLGSVAEFYEEDVNTKMAASLALIEPIIMIVMGVFVAFVLVSLYLPIFSLSEAM
ncbi:MAG TPA: type II secretion system F family protein [Bryobacteraceae bacterium]|nr:type II secretion system F family protein [Bryobacteraceae bacterium]